MSRSSLRPSLSHRLKALCFEALARVQAGSGAAVEALAALFRRSHGARTIEARVEAQSEANSGGLRVYVVYAAGVLAEAIQAGHKRARAPFSTLAKKAMDNAAR